MKWLSRQFGAAGAKSGRWCRNRIVDVGRQPGARWCKNAAPGLERGGGGAIWGHSLVCWMPDALQVGVGAQISCWAWVGSYRCLSGDALRYRHAEPGHPVEHRAGDPGLGLLAGQSPGAEATTDDGLVSEHGGFPERAPAIADRLLPAQAA